MNERLGESLQEMANLRQQAGRQTARAMLSGEVSYLRERADEIEALLKSLPEELTPAADMALWKLAMRWSR